MRIFDVFFAVSLKKGFEQTVELSAIWNAMTPILKHTSGTSSYIQLYGNQNKISHVS